MFTAAFGALDMYLHQMNILSTVVRLVLSVLLAGLIGLERERKQHAAGFRTHIMVSLASTLVMLTNIYVFENIANGSGDPTRMAAQVISGIGFLGAGTIMITGRTQQQVRGLTTAASLWASACIGLSVGSGFYLAAIVATVLMLIVMTVLSKIDQRYKKATVSTNLYIEMADISAMRDIIRVCKDQGWQIVSLEMSKGKQGKSRSLAIMMQLDTLVLTLRADALCEEIEKVDDGLFVVQLEAP